MTAFFPIQLSRVAHSPLATALPVDGEIARRSSGLAAAAVRVAAASGELGLFIGMLLAVAVPLVVMAGFFV